MKALFSILFLLLTCSIYPQEPAAYKLTIDSSGMGEDYKYKIELLRTDSLNIIIVKKKEPGSNLVLSTEDSLRAVNLLTENSPESKEALFQLVEKNTVYLFDSIALQGDHPILKLTDSFFQDRKSIKQNLEENRDERIILDGFTVYLTLDNFQGKVDRLYAISPTAASHPEIHRLVSEIIKAYIQEAEKPILSKGL